MVGEDEIIEEPEIPDRCIACFMAVSCRWNYDTTKCIYKDWFIEWYEKGKSKRLKA